MYEIWLYVSDPTVQKTLSWIGGGIMAVAAGIWAVIKFGLTSARADKSAGVSATTGQGIAAVGDVNFQGRMIFKRGVSAWLILAGFIGLAILIFGLFARAVNLSVTEAEELISGNVLQLNSASSPLTLVFEATGIARAYSFESTGSPELAGSWHISSNAELCLSWIQTSKGTPNGCFSLKRNGAGLSISRGHEITYDLRLAEDYQSEGAKAAIAAEHLEGLWKAGGYQCPVGVFHVELVRVEATSGDGLVATKELGDDCVQTGEVTWRGTLKNDVLDVEWHAGSPSGIREWQAGSIKVLNRNFMLEDVSGSNERAFFQRMK